MADPAHVEEERRRAPLAAAAAFAAAVLNLASFLIQAAAVGDAGEGDRGFLATFDANRTEFVAVLALQALSYILLAYVLDYLLRAIMARREETPGFFRPLIYAFPLLLIAGGIVNQIDVGDIAKEFTDSGPRTEDRADDLLDDRAVLSPILGSAGSLCLALSFVFVALNAMRVGLLSRFMGVLGILLGALLVLPLLPGGQGVIQIYWLAAIGFLILGRWPGGRGPAWDTGQAIEWPSAADRRFEEQEAPPAAAEEPPAADPDAPAPRKRKRKR